VLRVTRHRCAIQQNRGRIVAAIPRASPYCGVKDEEMVAHYARTDGRSPGVIRLGQLGEPVGSSAAMTCIVRIRTIPVASDR
jgi:hypothetical protein